LDSGGGAGAFDGDTDLSADAESLCVAIRPLEKLREETARHCTQIERISKPSLLFLAGESQCVPMRGSPKDETPSSEADRDAMGNKVNRPNELNKII
jgi:hypothetical protein